MDVVIYLHPFFEVGQKENDDTTSSKCDAKVDGGSYAHRRITDLRRNDFLGIVQVGGIQMDYRNETGELEEPKPYTDLESACLKRNEKI